MRYQSLTRIVLEPRQLMC